MKRDLAIEGLDREARDYVGGLFRALLANISQRVDDPFEGFSNGLAKVSKAYDGARERIDKLPE